MEQKILEFLTYGAFYCFFLILLIWGVLMLRARDKRWEEEARLRKEQEASQA